MIPPNTQRRPPALPADASKTVCGGALAIVAAAWLFAGCAADDRVEGAADAVVRSEAIDTLVEPEADNPTEAPGDIDPIATAPATEPRADEGPEPEPVSPDQHRSSETLVAHVKGDGIVAYSGPASTQVVGSFASPNRHGTELVFQALVEPDSDLVDSGWIPVLLPMRPNGTTGWIRTDEVELTRNPFRIEVDVDDFTLTVFRDNDLHFQTVVGIGEGDTPTPYGSFFLTDLLRPTDPTDVYGPYAYGLSGFSESLTSFNGGDGVIGIHGTNQPSALGTRVSHGCIRMANTSITELAAFLPLGTPVVIGDDPGRAINGEPEAPTVG